jgi:hypothetical protein
MLQFTKFKEILKNDMTTASAIKSKARLNKVTIL